MVWSNGFILGPTGESECELMARTPSRGPVTLGALLAGQVQVLTSATVVGRGPVSAVGGFQQEILRGQDFDLWAHLLKHGARAGYHQGPLIYYRHRECNLSGGQLSQLDRALAMLQHIDGHLDPSGVEWAIARGRLEELAARRMVVLGKQHLAAGEYLMATEAFADAQRRLPSRKLRAVLALRRIVPPLTRLLYLTRRGSS